MSASPPYIPAKTAERLNGHAPKGTRHSEAMSIALPLLGNGLSPQAVWQTLRDKFPEDVTDKELQDVVRWAESKNPTPSGFGRSTPLAGSPRAFQPLGGTTTPKQEQTPPAEVCAWWLNGAELTVEQFAAGSVVLIPEDAREALRLFLRMLYAETEHVNIVTTHIVDGGKARPHGPGRITAVSQWIEYLAAKPVPQSEAGAWFRPNPVKPVGTGSGGAVTDDDVVSLRFLLVESDQVGLGQQMAMLAKLPLPIQAVYLSGGVSVHALVRMDSPDPETHHARCTRILAALKPFGVDQPNKNPSRLSRLPGSVRTIGGVNGGRQTLLRLSPAAEAVTEEVLAELEQALLAPVVDDRPLHKLAHDSTTRYEEMIQNQGKLGVPTGVAEFDRQTGGLKPGQVLVLAAGTNCGKSTVALNIANTAAKAGYGVAFFSLEMEREEIFDLLVSMNGAVNRNCFNTGEFSERDVQKIIAQTPDMAKLPFWIFDDPAATLDDIELRLKQLAGKVHLVVVDYIQILSVADPREPREQQVAGLARGIRILSKKVKLPFIVLSQLNDDGKLRESRVVAHEATSVILLEANGSDLELKVLKGRFIQKKTYIVGYEPQFCRITPPTR